MKLFDKIKSLDIEKKGLETGKNNFIFCENNSINRRLYKKNSIQTDNLFPEHIEKFYFQTVDLCAEHIEKYYAVEEFKNIK